MKSDNLWTDLTGQFTAQSPLKLHSFSPYFENCPFISTLYFLSFTLEVIFPYYTIAWVLSTSFWISNQSWKSQGSYPYNHWLLQNTWFPFTNAILTLGGSSFFKTRVPGILIFVTLVPALQQWKQASLFSSQGYFYNSKTSDAFVTSHSSAVKAEQQILLRFRNFISELPLEYHLVLMICYCSFCQSVMKPFYSVYETRHCPQGRLMLKLI